MGDKMKKGLFVILTAALTLFVGCKNLLDEGRSSEKAGEAKNTTYLHIASPVVQDNTRTVLPDFTIESLSDFVFSLQGMKVTSGNNSTEMETLGTYAGMIELSRAEIPCSEGIWSFVLVAMKDGTVFSGQLSRVQITSGENQLNFVLTFDRTSLEGRGNLIFKLDYASAECASDVKLVTAELLKYDVITASEISIDDYPETILTPENCTVTFNVKDLESGNYRVKIYLYADAEKTHLINTWRELAIITGGQTSIANRKFDSLNEVYKITCNLAGGSTFEGAPLPSCYTRHSGEITLPVVYKTGYSFEGWFAEDDFSGQVVEKIPAGSTGDKTFYAKWKVSAITVSLNERKDISLIWTIIGTSVKFEASAPSTSATSGASFIWKVDGNTDTTASGNIFTFNLLSNEVGTYEIEVIHGDLSTMAVVKVNSFDSYIYVSASTTASDENDGTVSSPLATIAKAVEKMNDSTKDYTILIDGMLGRSVDSTQLTSGQLIAEFEPVVEESAWKYRYKAPILAKSITLMGLNPMNEDGEPVDGINPSFGSDTNGKSTPVLLIATSVPVILQNLKLSGGFLKSGEALMIGGTYRDENDEGVDVTANVTIKDGVLITKNNMWNEGTSMYSMYQTMVRIGPGCSCKMEGGKITDNVSGLGVLTVARNATFEMTGGYIGGNHLYPYFSGDYSVDPTIILTCGVLVVGPAADGSMPGGLFKISGDAIVDEIYLQEGAVVTVAGALTSASKIQIEPKVYQEGAKVIDVTDTSGLSLEGARDYFTVKANDDAYWQILEDGTLFEGYLSSVSGLSDLLSSLSANTEDSPYKVSIDDSRTDFDSLLNDVNQVLTSGGKYVWLSFKDSNFTKIEGEFNKYVTCLTIPESVTSLGFIDGEGIQRFKVASGNENFAVSGVVLCSKDLNTIYRWPPACTATVGTIPVNVYSIADGAFANCLNIKEFSVLEGNTYFKVTSGDTFEMNSNGLKAYQNVRYFEYDDTIGPQPDFGSTEWSNWANQVSMQYKSGHATVGGILTSYNEKTLVAFPPALELLTADDVKEKCGGYETDQGGVDITYSADSSINLYFDNVRPYALCGVKNVPTITLGVTATSLPAYTFKDCSGLKYVNLSHAGSTISAYTFSECTTLESVSFKSESIITVETNALYGCTALNLLWFQAGEGHGDVQPGAYPSTCNVNVTGLVN